MPKGNVKWPAATSTAGTTDRPAAAEPTLFNRIGWYLPVVTRHFGAFSAHHGYKACWSYPMQSVVRTNENDRSGRMQMDGQVECNSANGSYSQLGGYRHQKESAHCALKLAANLRHSLYQRIPARGQGNGAKGNGPTRKRPLTYRNTWCHRC